MSRRVLTALATLLLAAAMTPAMASAYWRAGGSGTASGTTGGFDPPTGLTAGPTPSSGSVTVRWSAASLTTGAAAKGYYVTRSNGTTSAAACGSSAASPVTGTSCTDTDAPEGTWTYEVTAVYGGWTATSDASRAVVVDRTAPAAPVLTAPADGTSQQARTITVTGTAEPASSVQLRNGAAAIGSATTAGDDGSWSVTLAGLADGAYALSARATDAAGNVSPASTTRTVTVDNVAPATSITSPSIGTTTATSASFTFTASETGATFECALDGGAYAACSSPKGYSGLAVGNHTFRVRATDAAGNVDTTGASQTWTVASPAPDTTIASNPAAITNKTTAAFTYSATIPGSTFECSLDGAAFATCPATGSSYTGLVAGSHTFAVRAINGSTPDPTPASYTWTIDQTAPLGSDFTFTNRTGGTAGKAETGDKLSLTYSEAIDPASLAAGWDGTGSKTVRVQFADMGNGDQIAQFLLDTGSTTVPLGVIALNANYVKVTGGGSTVTFSGSTLTLSGGGRTIDIVLGTPDNAGAIQTVAAASSMTWTPAAGAKDLAGNAAATSPVTKSMRAF